MEASQELALFKDVDFGEVNEESEKTRLSIAKGGLAERQTKTQKNRKKKLKVWNRFVEPCRVTTLFIFLLQRKAAAQNVQSQLDPNELLFFAEDLNVQPRDKIPPTDEEKHREKMFKFKISKMSETERRQFRTARDIRYLHKQNEAPTTTESSTADLPCLHHVAGKCEHKVCIFNHQMRLPRQFGVCRFYLKNACTKGTACTHMHSEFPCKFYYLGMPHPNGVDADNCRFTHGDVLNENTKRFFLKQIEFWVKEKTVGDAEEFERQMNDMITRFEEQEQKILNGRQRQEEPGKLNPPAVDVATFSSGETMALSEILNEAQVRRLLANKITSVDQLRQMSVAEMEDYLTIDQIYEIKSKRFKANHQREDEDLKCVEEAKQDELLAVHVEHKRQNPQTEEGQIRFSADDGGDIGETRCLHQNSIIDDKIKDKTDDSDSDSDSENRLVINDE